MSEIQQTDPARAAELLKMFTSGTPPARIDPAEVKARFTCADVLSRHGITWTGADIRCPLPGHDDKDPSFGLFDGGKAFKCHGCGRGGDCIQLEQELSGVPFPDALRTLADAAGITQRTAPASEQRRIVATYDYSDEAGNMLFQVVRYHPKDFRQRAPNGTGGWTWKTRGIRRPLFNLSAVLAAVKAGHTIAITEGEKDALALASFGITATTAPGGADKWSQEHTDTLRGADALIFGDKDAPGREHAAAVCKALHGTAARLRVVELPDRAGKPVKDAADWIEAGGTLEELLSIVGDVPDWTPTEEDETDAPEIVCGSDILAKEIPPPDMLIRELCDVGDKLFIIGSSKARKSFFTLQLAAHLASVGAGRLPLDVPRARRVLYFNLEIEGKHFSRRVQRMARSLELWHLERLFIVNHRGRPLSERDIMRHAEKVKADAIIIDPVYKLPWFDELDPTEALAAFDRIVEETRAALIVVHHERKGLAGDRQAIDRGSGSGKMSRDYDAALLLAAQRDDPDAVVMTQVQRNYAPQPQAVLKFSDGAFHVCDLPPIEATSKNQQAGAVGKGARLTEENALDLLKERGPLTATEARQLFRDHGLSRDAADSMRDALIRKGLAKEYRQRKARGKTFIGTPGQISKIEGAES